MVPPCSARCPDADGLERLKTPNGVLLLLEQYCSRQILKMSLSPKVLRKLKPGTGALHNYADLVDLRDLDRGSLLLLIG